MKKLSMFFSIIACTLALAGAVGFAAAPRLITPAYVNTLPNPDECSPASVECKGDGATCVKFVPEAGANHTIREWQANSTTCGDVLRMKP